MFKSRHEKRERGGVTEEVSALWGSTFSTLLAAVIESEPDG